MPLFTLLLTFVSDPLFSVISLFCSFLDLYADMEVGSTFNFELRHYEAPKYYSGPNVNFLATAGFVNVSLYSVVILT